MPPTHWTKPVMTELVLISALAALGALAAAALAQWLRGRPEGEPELVRTAELVARGVRSHLRRQHSVVASLGAVVGAAILVAYGLAYQLGLVTAASARRLGPEIALSYALGASLALLVGYVAARVAARGARRVAAALQRSLDEGLQIATRAGAVSALVAVALAVAGLALVLGAASWARGGIAPLGGPAATQGWTLVPALSAFALGACLSALLAQLCGGIFGKVADIGVDLAGRGGAPGPESPAWRAAVIPDLVGDAVGEGAARAAGQFAATVVEMLAAMVVAAMAVRQSPALPGGPALVLFAPASCAFGLLAACFGTIVVRTDGREEPMNALARGLLVSVLLAAVAAVGCAKWLLGEHWLPLGGCVACGAVAAVAVLLIVRHGTEPTHGPVRVLAEAARGGATFAALRGLVSGIDGSLWLLALGGAMAIVAFGLGVRTGLGAGGLLGLAAVLVGLRCAAAYVLAIEQMGSLVDAASGLLGTGPGALRPDVGARGRALDAVGSVAKAYGRALLAIASGLAGLLLAAAFLDATRPHPGAGIDVRSPALLFGAGAGLWVMLAFMRVTLAVVTRAARALVEELRGEHAAAPSAKPPLRGAGPAGLPGAGGPGVASSREAGAVPREQALVGFVSPS
ncbi:MAG: sodium/proton-translocating pyrophosphatase [Deltaproteobacteria bacterium]|nr:sodium/proton-translocating pyrophosphatase [Deltaproteobacteria bacterium]